MPAFVSLGTCKKLKRKRKCFLSIFQHRQSMFSAAWKHCAGRLWGDCQVGPRFPVLALFTNRNVFRPLASLHLHLFIQAVAQRHPPNTSPTRPRPVIGAVIYSQTSRLITRSASLTPLPREFVPILTFSM